MSFPPKAPPAVWRPLRVSDAPALADLQTVIDAAEALSEPQGPEMIEWFLSLPSIDTAVDTIGAFSPDGRALADVEVMRRGGDGHRRAVVFVFVHPDHPDLEPALIEWGENRARRWFAESPGTGDHDIRLVVDEHRHRYRRVIEHAGYRHARQFVTMRRQLSGPLGVPAPLPDGLVVRPWSNDLDEQVWRLSNEAFSDHWLSTEIGWDDWRAMYAEDPDAFLPDHSFVALDGNQVVALSLAESDRETDERTGVRELWINRVATTPEWRRRGLGSTLLMRTLVSGAADGFERAGLSVDEDSQTNATAIYERAGFEVVDRQIHYLKRLGT